MKEYKRIQEIKEKTAAELKVQARVQSEIANQQKALSVAKAALDGAQNEKKEILMSLARGEVSEKSVKQIRRACASFEDEIEEITETLDALMQLKLKTVALLKQMPQTLEVAKRKFWRTVLQKEIENLQSLVGDKFNRIWVVALLTGAADYNQLLYTILPQIPFDEANALKKKLKAEFRID